MRSNERNDKMILQGLEYLDDDIVSGALGRIDASSSSEQKTKKRGFAAWKLAPVLAACIMLVCLAIPTTTMVVQNIDLFSPVKELPDDGTFNPAPEYDGSRGLIYEVNEDGKSVSLVSFNKCDDEVIVVASYYNGLPVTRITNQPYLDLEYVPVDHGYDNKKVKRLVISDTVEEVAWGVLTEMPNLESIYIGASVKKIRFSTSAESKLSSIEISPENKKFTVKNNCLIEVATKKLVKGCLSSVIPDDGSVEIIGECSFEGVPLERIDLPEGIKVIEHGAFRHCYKIKSVVLPKSLEELGGSSFAHCNELELFDLNGFTYLPDGVLWWSPCLKELKGSENLTHIGENALGSCRSLKSISLGVCLEEIKMDAFSLYDSIVDNWIVINYAGTEAQWNAIDKEEDWNWRSDSLTVKCTDAELHPYSNRAGRGTLVTGD